MLKINQRQSEIYQYIKKNENVRTQELLQLFPVTPPTLRRDLSILEDAEMIVRTHGAARIASQKDAITPFEARSSLHLEAKKTIAKEAASLIEEGDSIILDSGTTTLEIARLLVDRTNLNIFTNSLPIATLFSTSNVNVTLTGGMLLGRNFSLQGPDAEEYLRRIEVDKTFVAASGVRASYGLVNSHAMEASIKKCMIDVGKTVYAVIDSSKFSAHSIHPSGEWASLDYIITDTPIEDEEINAQIHQAGVKVIVPAD